MNTYTVEQITKNIKNLLAKNFPETLCIKGEVSDISRAPSGHYYLSLKDEKAKISAVFFKNSAKFSTYIPKKGDSVKAYGDITLYEPGGQYQLMIRKIEYDTVGLFWQMFTEMKEKLEKEGLFDKERKRDVPKFVRRAAVLTSPTGAAVKDFYVTSRKLGGRFAADIWPVAVQGKEAAPKIVSAIEKVSEYKHLYDVLILTRGGGSLDDLAVFNEESVARALSASAVPTISAIGHERDRTICDLVADYVADTPTAAAQYVSAPFNMALQDINVALNKLERGVSSEIAVFHQRLDGLSARLENASPAKKLSELIRRREYAVSGITRAVRAKITDLSTRVDRAALQLGRYSPKHTVNAYYSTLDNLQSRLERRAEKVLSVREQRLHNLAVRLQRKYPHNKVRSFEQRLSTAAVQLEKQTLKKISGKTARTDELASKLPAVMDKRLNRTKERLEKAKSALHRSFPYERAGQMAGRLNTAENRLASLMDRKLAHVRSKLEKLSDERIITQIRRKTAEKARIVDGLCAQLKVLDPDNVLERGYSIVQSKDGVVSSIKDVHLQDELVIKVKDGYIDSFVTGRKSKEDNK